jgi:TonB family protein
MAALCWINPLSWLLLKEIRLNLEYMADEAAIPDEQEKKTYQYLLLDISQSNNELPSAIPFNYSFLKTRIRMINRKRSQTTSVFKYLLILPLFLAIVTANQCCTDQQPLQSEIEKVFPKPSEVQTKDSSTTASETSETPLEVAEIMPEFPGGTEALLSFIKDNLEYPQKAIDGQTEGRVIIRFVVNSNGEISDPTILKGINKNLDQAAIDVINKLPRWKPGQQDGQKVNVKYTLPVVFKLK